MSFALADPLVLANTRWRQYRFVGRDGFKTRWRRVPRCGIYKPSIKTARKLGDGYSLQLRS